MEEIFLESGSGRVCCAVEKKGGDSVAILGHGYISNKESRTNTELARRLNDAGISTISFDMFGHGKSDGQIENLTISKVVDNVISVYDFAKSEGFQKIGISGSSFTGNVSLISATKRDFDVIALKCPVFDSKALWKARLGEQGIAAWRENGFIEPFGKRWNYGAYEDASGYDMISVAKSIGCPVLVVHGNNDTTVPIEHGENIIKNVSSEEKKFEAIDGADHFFRNQDHFRQMVGLSFDWIKRYLG